jgi:MYXO-CTERM domain-containing protein
MERREKMTRLSGIAAIGFAGVLTSGALAGPLAVDPTALPGFHGTVSFNDGVLNVNVDYAVYAPGAYGVGDPSGGTRFVYAYQGFNVSTTRPFSNISVGLQNAALAFDGGFDPGRPLTGGVIPLFQDSQAGSGFPSSSFRSIFQNAGPFTKVNPGQYSQVLLFTSTAPPQFYSSSVIDEGQQVQHELPSPIPAPASLALCVLGGATFLRRRRTGA